MVKSILSEADLGSAGGATSATGAGGGGIGEDGAGGGGISVWDGYNGAQPWFNFVIFPTITFNATDVVTIRTY